MKTMRRLAATKWVGVIGLGVGLMLCGGVPAEAHGWRPGVSIGFGFPIPLPIPVPVFRYDPGPRYVPAPSCYDDFHEYRHGRGHGYGHGRGHGYGHGHGRGHGYGRDDDRYED